MYTAAASGEEYKLRFSAFVVVLHWTQSRLKDAQKQQRLSSDRVTERAPRQRVIFACLNVHWRQ